ncbi:Arv1-like family-domain-containing protein [Cyathus striatus]|nr:Arv1-like family-domain-containing protein [Cyathus striatus]
MPICTTCTKSVDFLYTVYESEYNLRLEQCSECQQFVDPYVEHDSLTLLIDLILLKRGVYRHLLYNQGSKPRRLFSSKNTPTTTNDSAKGSVSVNMDSEEDTQPSTWSKITFDMLNKGDKHRWLLASRLGGILVFLDAFIRWSYLNRNHPYKASPWSEQNLTDFIRVLLGCFAETLAFHFGIILACYIVLKGMDWMRSWRRQTVSPSRSGIRQEFRISLIPLSLFYSSLTKLFLLFLLTIWLPSSTPVSPSTDRYLTEYLEELLGSNVTYFSHALEFLDDDKIDKEWVVRNILGGMSAGFGLRVILDIHPFFTTLIILAGWTSKSMMASLIGAWASGDQRTGEDWLAYSIP